MKKPLRLAVAILATIGVAYVAFGLVATFLLPDCQLVTSAQVRSPNKRYFATFEQSVCSDPSKSHASVLLGAMDRKEKVVLYDIAGSSDVKLTWSGDTELQVTIPEGAVARPYNIGSGWPHVSTKRVPGP
jgi:hypothetical protein